MANSIKEFKKFVKLYPKLKYEVRDKKRTWQSIYEEWSLLGDDGSWDSYKEDEGSKSTSIEGQEFLRSALQYIKKLNVDDITKTMGSIQKVTSLISAFNTGNKQKQNQINYTPRRRVDPLFRRYDEYDE